MNLIVAVDENWAIGRDGDLLAHMKEDMKFFRKITGGHVVLMGRKTLDSFPGGQPLKNRVNIVLTGNPEFEREGVNAVHSVEELLNVARQYPEEELFVIGGGRVYRELLPFCKKAYVTHIHKAFPGADTWFPKLSESSEWRLAETGETYEQDGFTYTFTVYERQ